jgi:MraZ protein
MLFTGRYELNVDPKNRLSIPSSIRAGMDPEDDGGRFYLVPGRQQGTLGLYADKYFERYAHDGHKSLEPGRDTDEFETLFYAMATLLDVDKQGRVVLPQWLMQKAGLGKQVTLTGARDHLVLWNRDECDRYIERNYARHSDLLELARSKGRSREGDSN